MIEFICDYNLEYDKNTIIQLDYGELLMEECDFCIKINSDIFFKQPYFPILELLYCYYMWDKKTDFIYNAIESDENPLLSFEKCTNGWKINSVWKNFDCNTVFEIDDIVKAFETITDYCEDETGDGSRPLKKSN